MLKEPVAAPTVQLARQVTPGQGSAVTRRVWSNIAAGLVIAVFGATAAIVGWRVGRPDTPPPAPASAFLIAIRSMQSEESYQFSAQVTIGIEVLHVTGTFSAPDRIEETLQLVGGPPIHRLGVGAVTYQSEGGRWTRVSSAAAMADPRAVFDALADVANVTRQGSVYSFEVTGASVTALVSGGTAQTVASGTAAIANGRIQNLMYGSKAGAGTTVVFTYSNFGTAPPVTLPVGVPA